MLFRSAILGSMDRFIAFLIEETKGVFPVWLAPVQVKLIPVDDVTSMRSGTQASALDKIAIGNKSDVLVSRLHVVFEGREIGVSINAAVDVVFIEDDNVL